MPAPSSFQKIVAFLQGGAPAVEQLISPRQQEVAKSPMQQLGQQALTPDGDHIASILMDRLNNPAQVAGIMGNIEKEAGKDFDYSQKQLGGGPGRGLFQMEGDMLNAYNKYLKDEKLGDSPYAQIDFMVDILGSKNRYEVGDGHLKHLRAAAGSGNPELYAEEFSNRVERPKKETANVEGRKKSAREWYNKLTQGGR